MNILCVFTLINESYWENACFMSQISYAKGKGADYTDITTTLQQLVEFESCICIDDSLQYY